MERGVSECNLETSSRSRPRPTGALELNKLSHLITRLQVVLFLSSCVSINATSLYITIRFSVNQR
jgi:hypothetical protein